MKVVLFGNAPDKNAAIRYRVIKFAEMLSAEGHRCIICLPASTHCKERWYDRRSRWVKLGYLMVVLLRRITQLRHVIGADAVLLRGPLFDYGPPILEHVLHRLNPRMIFDIDDAVWEPPAHVDSPFLRFVDFGWMRKMTGLCAHAIVGNRYLEAHVHELMEHVTVIPTCVDMDKHQPKTYDEAPERPVRLGWTGLKDNLGYLELIEDTLRGLAKQHTMEICVASDGPYVLDGVPVTYHPWRLEHEFDYLREADIGLMPLKDTPRARGKCAFKALQYMGVGTPAVISPVGMNAEVIEDGVDGFLAASPEEWREKLGRLIVDPALRRRMGEAARETVRRRYSHDAHYPRWKEVIEHVAARKRK